MNSEQTNTKAESQVENVAQSSHMENCVHNIKDIQSMRDGSYLQSMRKDGYLEEMANAEAPEASNSLIPENRQINSLFLENGKGQAVSKYIELCNRNRHLKALNPVSNSKILVFDIDFCLYHNEQLFQYEINRVREAFCKHSERDEAHWEETKPKFHLFRQIFHHNFGTGLKDFDEAYELPELENYVKPDQELRNMILRIPTRKVCLTNGSASRAKKVLTCLGMEDLFEAVFCCDVEDTEFICKPLESAYTFVESVLGIEDKKMVHFYDDSHANVEGALRAGWNAYLVSNNIKEHLVPHFDE